MSPWTAARATLSRFRRRPSPGPPAPSGLKIELTVPGWLADEDVLAVAEALRGCWGRLTPAQQRLALTVEIALHDVVAQRYARWMTAYADLAAALEDE